MQIKLKPKRLFYVVLLQPSIAPLHSYIYMEILQNCGTGYIWIYPGKMYLKKS